MKKNTLRRLALAAAAVLAIGAAAACAGDSNDPISPPTSTTVRRSGGALSGDSVPVPVMYSDSTGFLPCGQSGGGVGKC